MVWKALIGKVRDQAKLRLALLSGMFVSLLCLISNAAYTNALYNSCLTGTSNTLLYNFALCPLNVILFLPNILEFCAFLIIYRGLRPPSYALSFLGAAIISYMWFGIVIATGSSSSAAALYLAESILFTICWIAVFAYEINHPNK